MPIGDLQEHESNLYRKVWFGAVNDGEHPESMWVRVESEFSRTGTLDNDPVSLRWIKRGDTVWFDSTWFALVRANPAERDYVPS